MSRKKLYIFFGMIASGKSTLAEMFAAAHHYPAYNTDRVRKELAGLQATERRPDGLLQGIYSPEFTEKTYREMLHRAGQDLKQGSAGVVLDGSYSKRDDRTRVITLAEKQNAETLFILCFCSDQEVQRRLHLPRRGSRPPGRPRDGHAPGSSSENSPAELPDLRRRALLLLQRLDRRRLCRPDPGGSIAPVSR